jgi:UDP-N-acetylglucosamine 2-epimerase (non-hydrolysing)
MVVVPPIGYEAFLALMTAASVVVSDSGGVQEEVSVLKVPLVVLRRSTERPEVLGTFADLTDDPHEMLRIAESLISRSPEVFERLSAIPSPYGDGSASRKIAESLRAFLE